MAGIIVAAVVVQPLSGQEDFRRRLEQYKRDAKSLFQRLLFEIKVRRHFAQWRELQKTQMENAGTRDYHCDAELLRSTTRPTSVHRLRPGDIGIVAALGDSLTVS